MHCSSGKLLGDDCALEVLQGFPSYELYMQLADAELGARVQVRTLRQCFRGRSESLDAETIYVATAFGFSFEKRG